MYYFYALCFSVFFTQIVSPIISLINIITFLICFFAKKITFVITFNNYSKFKTVENANAIKLIKLIQSDLVTDGIVTEQIVPNLKKLREYALLEEVPTLVKAIRLTYEHIEANNAFFIAMPNDEPIDESDEVQTTVISEPVNDIESLQYLLSLFKDPTNKHNIIDLKEYNSKLAAF